MMSTSSSTVQPFARFSFRLVLAGIALAFSACDKQSKDAAAKPAAAPAQTAAASTPPASAAPAAASIDQRVSYGLGYSLGSKLSKQHEMVADRDSLKAGLDDGLAGNKTRYSDADIQAAFNEVQQKVMAAGATAAEKQLAEGKAYLEKNRTRPGVTTTPSGLQYEVLTKGTGAKPKPTDTVEVHYQGTLIDCTIFDSSIQRGQPISFSVGGVIPGWTEALQLMSVGAKWRLTIPANLAYGPRGTPTIPPNSVLIFEVQLLGIK